MSEERATNREQEILEIQQRRSRVKEREDNTMKKNFWVTILIILALLLTGHIVWCLKHHFDRPMCHICDRLIEKCTCAEEFETLKNRRCTACGNSEAECTCAAKIEELTALSFCSVCNNAEENCTCAKKIAELENAQHSDVEEECEDGCKHCKLHCPAEVTPTPKPTKKPGGDDGSKPSPTKKPAPKPTKCPHSNTHKEEGSKVSSGNEWTQTVYVKCNACGATVKTLTRGGRYEDVMLPDNSNSIEYTDQGEDATPVE